MKRLFVVSLVLALVVLSCSAQKNSLIGTWRFTYEGETFDVEFTQTRMLSKMLLGDDPACGYRVDGNKVYALDEDGDIMPDAYFLIQDKNTLSFVVGDKALPGKKIGGSTSSSTSNQKNSIIGAYTSNGESFLESIEIVDGKNAVLNYDVVGMSSSVPATYKITGTRLIVSANGDSILFDINNGSLKGLTIGSTGTFHKK